VDGAVGGVNIGLSATSEPRLIPPEGGVSLRLVLST
jgi:hypothetical protein